MLRPTVEVRDEGGVLVAEFWDCLRLDPAPVQELRNQVDQHLRRGGRPDLAVDLNGVTFAGSASLGGFLAIHKLLRPRSGRIVFFNVDPTVFEVFRVSKLDSLFAFAPDRAGAMTLLRRSDEGGGEQPGDPGKAPSAPPRPAPSSSPPPLRGRRRPT